MKHVALKTGPRGTPLPAWHFWSVAALLVFLAYALVFLVTGTSPWPAAIFSSIRNLMTLGLAATAAYPLIRRIDRFSPSLFLPAHVFCAVFFATFWYWLIMLSIGLSAGPDPMTFSVRQFFPVAASVWQLLQGTTVYALLVAMFYVRNAPGPVEPGAFEPEVATAGADVFSRYFFRQGEDMRPLDLGDVISITGADDYSEVSTMTDTQLVRMTLTEFERALEGKAFLRVHRSRIVNVDRIQRAEPAGGGRLLLHMENGQILQASKAGARLLRERLI